MEVGLDLDQIKTLQTPAPAASEPSPADVEMKDQSKPDNESDPEYAF